MSIDLYKTTQNFFSKRDEWLIINKLKNLQKAGDILNEINELIKSINKS
jgi:hypothetical protein